MQGFYEEKCLGEKVRRELGDWVSLKLQCLCEPEVRKVGGRSLVLCRLGRAWQNC